MKKISIICIACILLQIFALEAHAAESQIINEFTADFEKLLEGMPESLKTEYSSILSSPDGVQRIRESISFSAFTEKLTDSLHAVWPSVLSLFYRLFVLVVCAGLFRNFNNSLASQPIADAVSFCITLSFAVLMTSCIDSLLKNTILYLENLAKFSAATVPLTVALSAASGKLTAASVTHAALMLLFTLIQNVGTVLLLPVVQVSYALGIVGTVGKFIRIDSVTKCIRKVFTTVLAFLSLAVAFIIGTQNALARSADTFSIKTVKFALGNVIPLVGGAMSEAVSTVTTALGVIRTTAGGLCVLAVLALFLPIMLELILHRLVFSVLKGIAELLGCETEGMVIDEIHGTIGYILALVCLVSVLLLFAISLFTLLGGETI